MTEAPAETRSVVIEREFAHSPNKLWRALTQPHLIQEWLMKNDFAPVVGHRFNLSGDWGGVLDCEVLEVEPNETLLLHLELCQSRSGVRPAKRRDVHAHARGHRHSPANGASGIPAGSEAGVRGRKGRVGAVPGQARRTAGTLGLVKLSTVV